MAETPSVRNTAQAGENARKNSFLNYESPALTAELQARITRETVKVAPAQEHHFHTAF
jgi:hypothetical protein